MQKPNERRNYMQKPKNKKIFIINGSGGVGKDKFVTYVSKYVKTENFSSVEKVKELAIEIGWDGVSKTERDRKFLSDLKVLCSNYCNMPLNEVYKKIRQFKKQNKNDVLFIHIREPEEISSVVMNYPEVKTILMQRNSVQKITSNMADANVENYNYDIVIKNNYDLLVLEEKAKTFIKDFVMNNKETKEQVII